MDTSVATERAASVDRATGQGRRSLATTERIAGLSALLLAAGYIATMPLFSLVGAPPAGAAARLAFHSTGTDVWWAIVALSVLTDFLFVPVAVGSYAALLGSNELAMLAATVFILLFVALDLAVLWPAKVALIGLGQAYGIASPEEQSLLLAAAAYPSAVLDSALTAVYSVLTLALGILIIGVVMLRAGFGRATAAVGIGTGVLGIISVVETVVTGSFPILVVAASLLTIVWLVMVGLALSRIGGPVQMPRG